MRALWNRDFGTFFSPLKLPGNFLDASPNTPLKTTVQAIHQLACRDNLQGEPTDEVSFQTG